MVEEAARARETLAAGAEVPPGLHPRLDALHGRHAERLAVILTEHGWPGVSHVGPDGEWAAFLLVQHAIAHPQLVRRAAAFLQQAAARGDAPPSQFALLVDRMCWLEGRPQVFGTQYEWDEAGALNPAPIEDPGGVDARRAGFGLPPLSEQTARMRANALTRGEQAPADRAARRQELAEWARGVGWRDAPFE